MTNKTFYRQFVSYPPAYIGEDLLDWTGRQLRNRVSVPAMLDVSIDGQSLFQVRNGPPVDEYTVSSRMIS